MRCLDLADFGGAYRVICCGGALVSRFGWFSAYVEDQTEPLSLVDTRDRMNATMQAANGAGNWTRGTT